MFRAAHMSFRIFGHTVTDTSPRCAFLRSAMYVRDWPMPPPTLTRIPIERSSCTIAR